MNHLYEQEQFAVALEIAKKAEADAGGFRSEAMFWQACLLCRLGRQEEGLARLKDLVEAGGWVAAEWLLWDPALEPLRGREEFKALLPIVTSRRDEAEKATKVSVHAALPGAGRKKVGFRPLLVLHGRGNEGQDALERWMPAVKVGYALFSLQSSQPWSPGLYQWDNEHMVRHDLEAGLDLVHATNGVAARPPVLGGYSQGALVALRAMLEGVAGGAKRAILVSPSVRTDRDVGGDTLDRVRGTKLGGWSVYTISGEKDFSLPFQQDLHAALKAAGAKSELDIVPGGVHDYPKDFSERLPKALAAVDPIPRA